MPPERVGILDLELYVPGAYLELADLEAADGCVGKYTQGLGLAQMGVCDAREDAVSLALAAACALLERTGTDPARVGRVDLGTESLVDAAVSISNPFNLTLLKAHMRKGAARLYGAVIALPLKRMLWHARHHVPLSTEQLLVLCLHLLIR